MSSKPMQRVVIESPYAGKVQQNITYARECLRDSLLRGESPIASHLLYTQPGILNDDNQDERSTGISAGHFWIPVADSLVVYTDKGISEGMKKGIAKAHQFNKPVHFRKIKEQVQWKI